MFKTLLLIAALTMTLSAQTHVLPEQVHNWNQVYYQTAYAGSYPIYSFLPQFAPSAQTSVRLTQVQQFGLQIQSKYGLPCAQRTHNKGFLACLNMPNPPVTLQIANVPMTPGFVLDFYSFAGTTLVTVIPGVHFDPGKGDVFFW